MRPAAFLSIAAALTLAAPAAQAGAHPDPSARGDPYISCIAANAAIEWRRPSIDDGADDRIVRKCEPLFPKRTLSKDEQEDLTVEANDILKRLLSPGDCEETKEEDKH